VGERGGGEGVSVYKQYFNIFRNDKKYTDKYIPNNAEEINVRIENAKVDEDGPRSAINPIV